MIKTLKCIMLVDDNPDDNFFHERAIRKCNAAEVVVVRQSGKSALEYLRSAREDELRPDLIFLDINMPGMTGWEFLERYEQLDSSSKGGLIVVILTTSENPDDRAKANEMHVSFTTKPLTPDALEEIIGRLGL